MASMSTQYYEEFLNECVPGKVLLVRVFTLHLHLHLSWILDTRYYLNKYSMLKASRVAAMVTGIILET